ncbi:MAG TPA: efflux RND transporter periplasmic adaptor subunit [Polyangiales bacterium]|nr:efflux RND transporter periplasmic adaptor subunit [Polyangiales bacterium]
MNRRSRVALITVAACCACHPQPEAAGKSLTVVKVRAVESSSAAASARYAADIEPASRVDLAFKVSGYIDTLAHVKGVDGKPRALQEGDRVTRGMELASIRKQEYANKLSEADAGLAEAVAAREQAELDFERATKLVAGNSISAAELDNTRVRLHAASARADGARVRVEEARTMLDDTSIKSPIDGMLLRRNIEVGTLAAPGTIAFAVADTGTMKVVFGVPDTVRGLLDLGANQAVTTEAFAGVQWRGRVTRIASIADPKTRLFDVEITIDNAAQQLKAGMVAALQLSGRNAAQSVAVLPLSAVVRSHTHRDGFAVFELDDKRNPPVVQLRDVELGQFLGNVIPIQSGLAAGEKVVVQGASLLSDREAVRVIP